MAAALLTFKPRVQLLPGDEGVTYLLFDSECIYDVTRGAKLVSIPAGTHSLELRVLGFTQSDVEVVGRERTIKGSVCLVYRPHHFLPDSEGLGEIEVTVARCSIVETSTGRSDDRGLFPFQPVAEIRNDVAQGVAEAFAFALVAHHGAELANGLNSSRISTRPAQTLPRGLKKYWRPAYTVVTVCSLAICAGLITLIVTEQNNNKPGDYLAMAAPLQSVPGSPNGNLSVGSQPHGPALAGTDPAAIQSALGSTHDLLSSMGLDPGAMPGGVGCPAQ